MDAETDSTEMYLRILSWLHARRKPLLIGAITVAVLGLVAALLAWNHNRKESDADEQLFAVPIESGPRAEAVSPKALLDVAQDYPGTSSGEKAKLLGAEALFTQGKYPEAQREFSEFINDYPESPLIAQAKIGVAASLEAQGKTSEAIQKYKEIIFLYPSEASIVSPAKLVLARLYDEAGQPQEALSYYSELARILSQNPYDPWGAEARERAQILLAKHPELMKAAQSSAAPATPSAPFSVSGTPKQAAPGAAPAPAPKAPAANANAPQLLTFPGASTNATKAP
jgi:tetratricopeptide (TPR) repeat protein